MSGQQSSFQKSLLEISCESRLEILIERPALIEELANVREFEEHQKLTGRWLPSLVAFKRGCLGNC